MLLFVASAFRHGYTEEDFYELLDSGPLKMRSRRGLDRVYELYGRNYAGDCLHVAYRKETDRDVVFHMRRMSTQEKRFFRRMTE